MTNSARLFSAEIREGRETRECRLRHAGHAGKSQAWVWWAASPPTTPVPSRWLCVGRVPPLRPTVGHMGVLLNKQNHLRRATVARRNGHWQPWTVLRSAGPGIRLTARARPLGPPVVPRTFGSQATTPAAARAAPSTTGADGPIVTMQAYGARETARARGRAATSAGFRR